MQSAPPSPEFSRLVSALRFPLILLVVSAHLLPTQLRRPQVEQHYIYSYLVELMSHVLARVAVPLFFFISGYFSFWTKDWRRREVFLPAWRKRLRSVLQPFLLWNALAFVLLSAYSAVTTALGGTPAVHHDPSWTQLPHYFTDQVLDYPLWFMRDLICLTLLSPLIYYLLGLSRGWILLPLALLFVLDREMSVAMLGSRALFFFPLGGWMAIEQLDPLQALRRLRYPLLGLALLLALTTPFCSYGAAYPYYRYVLNSFILTGCLSVLAWGHQLLALPPRLLECSAALSRYVMYIYAAHALLLLDLGRWLAYLWAPLRPSGALPLLGYLLAWGLTVGLCFLTFALFKRLAPRLLALLYGARL